MQYLVLIALVQMKWDRRSCHFPEVSLNGVNHVFLEEMLAAKLLWMMCQDGGGLGRSGHRKSWLVTAGCQSREKGLTDK